MMTWMIAFLLCGFGMSTAIFTPEEEKQIEDVVNNVLECRRVPGLTLAVVQGNKTWTRGFGFADLESQIPVTSSTLFGIGSVTKAFTTTLLAMLLNDTHDGKLYTWTTKVSEILEDFRFVDDERTRETTLRDILCHRTGLQQISSGFLQNASREHLSKRLRFLEEKYPFRDVFAYNNWMYMLAGYICETMSGQTWENLLQTRIFTPLGMTHTKVIGYNVETSSAEMAQAYVLGVNGQLEKADPAIYRISSMSPAGGIASSADDMTRWMLFHHREGKTEAGDQLVNVRLLRETTRAHSLVSNSFRSIIRPKYPVSSITSGYGYGWFEGTYRGFKVIWHSGEIPAYVTNLWMFPDLDISIFVSVNGPGGSQAASVIPFFVADILLKENQWLNVSTACTFPAPWNPATTQTVNTASDITNDPIAGSLISYMGIYGHQLFGDLEIRKGQLPSELWLKFGFLEGTLNTTKKDHNFKLDVQGSLGFLFRFGNVTVYLPVVFSDLKDGKFKYVNIIYNGEIVRFSRDVRFESPITDDVNDSANQNKHVSLGLVLVIVWAHTWLFKMR